MEGLDIDKVSRWIEANVTGIRPPLAIELIEGGRSNLTYRLEDAKGQAFVLRRPPLGQVLPTAHDMAREYQVISALADSPVPVPQAYGICRDETVTGAPFYVMSYIEGHIMRGRDGADALDIGARQRAGRSVAETLAALHALDVDAVGLGNFAKRDAYIERQLRRWHRQFWESGGRNPEAGEIVDAVHRELAANVPPQGAPSIVHGDYRLDNVVLSSAGEVVGVLDWEICTLGDGLADVGLLMVYWAEPGDEDVLLGLNPTAAPGFPSRSQMQAYYESASGRALPDLNFYTAFGYWKLACIRQGVYARYMAGAAAGDRSIVDGYADSVVKLAKKALKMLSEA